MCQVDVSVITHVWVAGIDVPRADFSTLHKCRDFESILQWSHERQGNWTFEHVKEWRKDAKQILPKDP